MKIIVLVKEELKSVVGTAEVAVRPSRISSIFPISAREILCRSTGGRGAAGSLIEIYIASKHIGENRHYSSWIGRPHRISAIVPRLVLVLCEPVGPSHKDIAALVHCDSGTS